jgi:hypothetical protein
MSVPWLKNCSKTINFDHSYFTLLLQLANNYAEF